MVQKIRLWALVGLVFALSGPSFGAFQLWYSMEIIAPEGDTTQYRCNVNNLDPGESLAAINKTGSGLVVFPWYAGSEKVGYPVGTPSVTIAASPYTDMLDSQYTTASAFYTNTVPVVERVDYSAVPGGTVNHTVTRPLYIHFICYVNGAEPEPESSFDLYEWTYSMDDLLDGSGNLIYSEVSVYGGLEIYQMWNDSGQGDWSTSGSVEVERDVQPAPDYLLYTYTLSGVHGGESQVSFVDVGEYAAGGGRHYQASVSLSVESEDPFAINPTDPPAGLGPSNPNPIVPGGDTSPAVAENYTDFRDAVESALDNRGMSQEEIQTAMESALNNQGLDGENIKDALSNALKENDQTQAGQYQAVRSALNSQGLSADGIASAIGNEFADNGAELELGDFDYSAVITTNPSVQMAVETVEYLLDRTIAFTAFFEGIKFPQGMSQISAITAYLGGHSINLSWGHIQEFAYFRTVLQWMVHVLGSIGIIATARRAVA